MHTLRLLLLLAAALGAAGCGGGPSSAGSQATMGEAEGRLVSLTALDERVARVSQRLLAANVPLCPTTRLSAGWALHSAQQYSTALRPYAEGRFGLEGDLPGVLAAPAGTAAAEAGLKPGDLILSVNQIALSVGERGVDPGFEGLAANLGVLDTQLSTGQAELTIRRDGANRQLTIEPRPACGYDVQLNPSDELNARADGRRLFISTALAAFAESDDELAIILGHELAHHVLRHRAWNDTGGLGRTENTAAGTPGGGPGNAEQQADRVGLYLMARAGYDPAVAAPFWRRFGASNWRVRYPQLRHASAETRARLLEGVANEIRARQALGGDLLP